MACFSFEHSGWMCLKIAFLQSKLFDSVTESVSVSPTSTLMWSISTCSCSSSLNSLLISSSRLLLRHLSLNQRNQYRRMSTRIREPAPSKVPWMIKLTMLMSVSTCKGYQDRYCWTINRTLGSSSSCVSLGWRCIEKLRVVSKKYGGKYHVILGVNCIQFRWENVFHQPFCFDLDLIPKYVADVRFHLLLPLECSPKAANCRCVLLLQINANSFLLDEAITRK